MGSTKKGYRFELETAGLGGVYGHRIPGSGAFGTISHNRDWAGDVHWDYPWFNKPMCGECKHGYTEPNQKAKSMRIYREWFDKHLEQTKGFGHYPFFAMKLKWTTEKDGGMSKFLMIPFPTWQKMMVDVENMYLELQELRDEQENSGKT